MPLSNIRNKLCEATTQTPWARNVEERHGVWCRNGDGRRSGNARKFHMCGPVQSKSQSANLQKLQTCQIPGVKWTNGSRNPVKFPAFENWLSARLRYFQCVCYRDSDFSWAINLYMTCWIWHKLGFRSGFLPEGRAVWAALQTTLELSLRLPCGI